MKPAFALILVSLLPMLGMAEREVKQPHRGMVVFKLPEGRLGAEEVFLMAVTKNHVAYKFRAEDAQPDIKRREEIDSIFLYDPADYLQALDLYESGQYEEAMKAFVVVKERCTRLYPGIPNNPGVMSGFYELECLRKLNHLEGLRRALQDFNQEALTSRVALQQIELYELWDAIRAGRNQDALVIADRYAGKRLPGDQRAQVAYCRGRAMEELMYLDHRVLMAYQTAITADAGASEQITRDAILRSLEILHGDEQAKDALRHFQQANGAEMILGFTKVMEAAGLCAVYEDQFGRVPAKYRHYLEFTPEKVAQRMEAAE